MLLLEGVHQTAVEAFQASGYVTLDYHAKALPEAELCAAIADAHIVGIRSRTQLTETVFAAARKLMAVGCFCIGTNQVDGRRRPTRRAGVQCAVFQHPLGG